MGNLKAGATYIYEHADGVTYAREFGSNERTAIGWSYDPKSELARYRDTTLWANILKEAETNQPLLQAVDRVILLYKLSVSKYD